MTHHLPDLSSQHSNLEKGMETIAIKRRISLRSSAQAELLVPRTRTVIRHRRRVLCGWSDGLE